VALKKIICTIIGLVLLNSFAFAQFIDIDDNHWGYNAVINMATNGVLSGYPDGSFKPSKNITLGEYASIFSNFFSIQSNDVDNYFINIDNLNWAKGKIEAIREYIQPNYDNISESLGNNKRAFEDGIVATMSITREVVMYSLAKVLALDESDYVEGEEKIFGDYDKILYPKEATLLYKNGIISGEIKDGKVYLAPDRYISRAEIAAMFNKLLVDGNKIKNTEGSEEFNSAIKNVIELIKEYKLNEVKTYLYDSASLLKDIDFDSVINKDIKNVINKYFNKLEYSVVDYGFYSYNKAYVTINKKAYDYTEILKPIKNISTQNLNDVAKEIVKVANKQKLKTVEVIETINVIKNNNEWKIEL
jgi:hypothetical protein